MARSKLDTLIYATILLAPMVTAVGYIAWAPAPDAVVVVVEAPTPAVEPAPAVPVREASPPAPAPLSEPAPAPVPEASPVAPSEPAEEAPYTRAPDPLPALPGAGMLMFEGQVILTTNPDTSWSKGRLRAPDLEDGVEATKLVDTARLPAELTPLVDGRVVVYATDGSACTATTGAMTIYARQDGDLGYSYDENGQALDAAGRLRLRKQVFASAQLLLARQSRISDEPRARRCEGVWARRADLPAPAVFGRRQLDSDVEDTLKKQVLATIADLPEVVSLRAAFEADRASYDAVMRKELPDWASYRDDNLVVTRWDEVGGGRSFVNVELGDRGEACSGMFSEQRFLLFALEGGLLVQQPGAGFTRPLALMDLERDGSLEAVTVGGTRLGGAADDAVVQRFEIPYHGCPC